MFCHLGQSLVVQGSVSSHGEGERDRGRERLMGVVPTAQPESISDAASSLLLPWACDSEFLESTALSRWREVVVPAQRIKQHTSRGPVALQIV